MKIRHQKHFKLISCWKPVPIFVSKTPKLARLLPIAIRETTEPKSRPSTRRDIQEYVMLKHALMNGKDLMSADLFASR